ncbi:MAG TPA: PAS domain-containing protein [Actinomycetota bacterium]|nr:PAS domain-containing protein [Actinomycetota bacterium]
MSWVAGTHSDFSALLCDALSGSPLPIFFKRTDGTYLYVNDAYIAAAGLERDHIVGHTDYEIYPSETSKLYRANDALTMERRAPLQAEEFLQVNDQLRWFSVVKFPLCDSRGGVQGTFGLSIEITDKVWSCKAGPQVAFDRNQTGRRDEPPANTDEESRASDHALLDAIEAVKEAEKALRVAMEQTTKSAQDAAAQSIEGKGLPDLVEGDLWRRGSEIREQAASAIAQYEHALMILRLTMIRGLVDDHGMTFAEVGRRMGISRQLVARLYKS